VSRSLPCQFFKAWTHEMAYVLGYWFADGNMYFQKGAGGYFVSIGSKDVAHLETLRAIIGTGMLSRITGSQAYKLVVCRKEMYDDLLRLGGTERKSLTLKWPDVPQAFLADFVRGYVNGDGCLTWHRPGRSVHPMISVAGTAEFLTGMGLAIQKATGIPLPIRHLKTDSRCTWVINWYGVRAKCLAIWLYRIHSGLALERKQVLVEAFSKWQPKLFDPSTTTPQMWENFEAYLQ
jgi:hypothetical protein